MTELMMRVDPNTKTILLCRKEMVLVVNKIVRHNHHHHLSTACCPLPWPLSPTVLHNITTNNKLLLEQYQIIATKTTTHHHHRPVFYSKVLRNRIGLVCWWIWPWKWLCLRPANVVLLLLLLRLLDHRVFVNPLPFYDPNHNPNPFPFFVIVVVVVVVAVLVVGRQAMTPARHSKRNCNNLPNQTALHRNWRKKIIVGIPTFYAKFKSIILYPFGIVSTCYYRCKENHFTNNPFGPFWLTT